MSSNYNYDFNLSHLVNLENVPEMSTEDIMSAEDRNSQLDFWINAEFQYYSPTIDTKLEDQDSSVNQPMIMQDLSLNDQTQQSLYPLFAFSNTNPLLQSNNFASLFPTAPIVPVSIPTVVNNPIILPKDASSENTSSATISEIIPETAKVITKTAAVADVSTDATPTITTKSNPSTNVTALSDLNPNRKNSSMKPSNLEIAQDEPAKTEDNEGKVDPELSAKLAAEEDKRRRNTAASARFRVKKKMREQALERTAREMTAKAETLESRVRELEMEIKWLRSLIVEKDARLLDVDRPGKKRKKDESDDEEEEVKKDEVSEAKREKREQSDQTNQKE
ncbi:4599_t:CDS:1 [Funneliformis mosseae]|uniref:4599_t:CDS:1 n=1 Tax=Funneliformis mosseae TaxID=27381 RepID=A0A9N8V582_FUNMO|nr:4599_t:CDS:1 [Funneliformis mosseae]